MSDEVATECAVCGGHIIAGSYPPVCSKSCRLEWDIETEFNRWVKDEARQDKFGPGIAETLHDLNNEIADIKKKHLPRDKR